MCNGDNVVVAQDADRPVAHTLGGIRVTVEPLARLIQHLRGKGGGRHIDGERAAAYHR